MTHKKILITGKNSYIGTALKNWLVAKDGYHVAEISLKDQGWQTVDFSQYDTVVHVAGIAHSDTKGADDETKARYYKINTDLTFDVATVAKKQGVKQFIFLSSIIVFSSNTGELNHHITSSTTPNPINFYGDSKLQAETKIKTLETTAFKIAIIRPPMVYGKGSKGNYPKLSKLATKVPFFPKVDNNRSMIHIDNLCQFLYLLIKNNDSGTYHPQNDAYVNTSQLVHTIRAVKGKKTVHLKGFAPMITALSKKQPLMEKLFSSVTYDQTMSAYKEPYCVRNFEESIALTEK